MNLNIVRALGLGQAKNERKFESLKMKWWEQDAEKKDKLRQNNNKNCIRKENLTRMEPLNLK